MTIKEFFSFKANKYFWVNLIAMVVVVCTVLFIVLKGLDMYTRHGEAVTVPDVKGMQMEEAAAFLRNRGLSCVVSDSSYVKNKPSGTILELIPAAGQKVKEGRVIYLTINTLDVPLKVVPDVADNSSVRQAQARMLAVGFKLTENELVNGEKDWVYGVKYNGRQLRTGDKIPAGATVTLMVGSGSLSDELLEDSTEVMGADESAPATTDESWF
ncbi:PASTA domain-containing protein [Bacteroides sp.]|uniref:PASTA domain-containing protein n=1 Tax=Bacteroides sp. TaxID=29523 RepID=UPI001B584381|nr:PASTA domain-containing protein [Bacteroides sp.]MBP6065267.1 PASTA domain-containing protein [Bacteroides sp.]MBP6066554.1 PASTA domain-containing protein [Bacteroides sp.]MBP6935726.1 PASTA domain-containing protein [Bacteroides sp.]MBP8622431.1 PASTA domain-containing protein [Bacteroides sp.]MBP9507253.1 PASTA domain-containing protein [Bacteroides sp.]